MRWQLILPFILAAFFVSCSKNAANINESTSYINSNNFYKTTKEEQNIIKKIIEKSSIWKNTPYVLGGTSNIKGADCSAYTQSIYKSAFGIDIKRVTTQQLKYGKTVDKNKLKAGDLVFFVGKGPNNLHVGIYLSNDDFIHLSSKGGARIKNLNDYYWKERYLIAKRYEGVK